MALVPVRVAEADDPVQSAPTAAELPELPDEASPGLKEWHRRLKKNQLDRVAGLGQSPGVRKVTLKQG